MVLRFDLWRFKTIINHDLFVEHIVIKIKITSRRLVREINTNIDIQTFESVDQIVSNQLANIDSDTYNKNTLLEIYNSL